MNRAVFTARDPAHMQPPNDGIPYVMTQKDLSKAAEYTCSVIRQRDKRNRLDASRALSADLRRLLDEEEG